MKSYIYLYTYIYSYLVILLCTAEDTLQSRALTTNAIAKYAAMKRKRREDRGSVQDEDSEGSEKEEQQSSGTEELVDRTPFQCSSNKVRVP